MGYCVSAQSSGSFRYCFREGFSIISYCLLKAMPCLWEMSRTHWALAFGADEGKIRSIVVSDYRLMHPIVHNAPMGVRVGYKLLTTGADMVFVGAIDGVHAFSINTPLHGQQRV